MMKTSPWQAAYSRCSRKGARNDAMMRAMIHHMMRATRNDAMMQAMMQQMMAAITHMICWKKLASLLPREKFCYG